MQQQKSQSAIKERKLGQIAHCSAHCGRPNYHQNYTRVLELGSASPRDAQFLVPVKTMYRGNCPLQDQKKKLQNSGKISKKNLCISKNPHKMNKKSLYLEKFKSNCEPQTFLTNSKTVQL